MKIIFKLKDGSEIKKTHDESTIINEAMLNILVQNFGSGKGVEGNIKNLSNRINEISSVKIIF